jgi:hypothetical protein
MARRYDDPVDVRRRDEVPVEFLWRGRLYVVRDVLSHWVETGAWWRSAGVRSAYSGDAGAAGAAGDVSAVDAVDAVDAVGGVDAADVPAQAGPGALDPGERELWRVEAGAGRASGTGVFDLCFDWGAGVWTLAQALD